MNRSHTLLVPLFEMGKHYLFTHFDKSENQIFLQSDTSYNYELSLDSETASKNHT